MAKAWLCDQPGGNAILVDVVEYNTYYCRVRFVENGHSFEIDVPTEDLIIYAEDVTD
jgi:hypothetical protein